MPKVGHEQTSEEALRAAFDRGDFRTTAELAFHDYGKEILGFLIARMHDHGRGNEAFSFFAEDLWRGLPSFAWRSSLRSWAYKLACNACQPPRERAAPARRAEPETCGRYERWQNPVRGLLAVGDAACCFNPVYGQGMSVAAAPPPCCAR